MCVYYLLKGRVFSKYHVDMSDWVYKQIEEAAEPIHHLLPSLLEELIEWLVSLSLLIGFPNNIKLIGCYQCSTISTTGSRMKRFSEPLIRQCFQNVASAETKPKEILMLYYVLAFNDRCIQKAQPSSQPAQPKNPLPPVKGMSCKRR